MLNSIYRMQIIQNKGSPRQRKQKVTQFRHQRAQLYCRSVFVARENQAMRSSIINLGVALLFEK